MTNDKKVWVAPTDAQIEAIRQAFIEKQACWFSAETLREILAAADRASPSPEEAEAADNEPTEAQLRSAGFDIDDDLDRPDRDCDCEKCKAFYDASDLVAEFASGLRRADEARGESIAALPPGICHTCMGEGYIGSIESQRISDCPDCVGGRVKSQPEAAGTAGGDAQPGGSDA